MVKAISVHYQLTHHYAEPKLVDYRVEISTDDEAVHLNEYMGETCTGSVSIASEAWPMVVEMVDRMIEERANG